MAEPSPPSPLPRPPSLLRRLTEGSFLFLVAFVVAGGVACYWLRGPEVFWQTSEEHLWLLLAIAPVLAGAVLLGAFIQALIPPGYVRARLGEGAGLRGIGIGSVIGLFVPGGPMISMPLLMAVIEAGADLSACIAFYMSWSLLALARIIQWELPLMGWRFALIRFLSSVPLPLIAGLIAIPLFKRLPHCRKSEYPP
ncbi:MAG TPA: permease [Alphaproteobacteria bacterium]